MIRLLVCLLLATIWTLPAFAQPTPPGGLVVGSTAVVNGTPGDCLSVNGSKLGVIACGTGSGSVTSVSVVSANGFGGTVATPTSTPAITITTSINALMLGNGTAATAYGGTGACSAGQFVTAISASGVATCGVPSGGGLTVGTTTITGGSSGNVEYNNGGVLGEMTTSGSGTVLALTTSPVFVTPALGTPASGTLTNTSGFPAANLAGTALPAAIVTSSLTSVGTLGSLAVTNAITSANHTITSTSATALAVGRQGTTNPVLTVNASTASVVTGISIQGAATGGPTTITATDSAGSSSLSINAKGVGALNIGNVSTGNIQVGNNSASGMEIFSSGTLTIGNSNNTSIVLAPSGLGTVSVTNTASTTAFFVGTGLAGHNAFTVDTSASSLAAGVKVVGAATGGTVAIATTDTGSANNLTINALSTGTIGIGTVSTGQVTLGASATVVSVASAHPTFPNVTTGTNTDVVCVASGNALTIQAAASCTISSRRFKQDIKPLEVNALNVVSKLQPVTFRMKPEYRSIHDPNGASEQIGMIAEQVYSVEPLLTIFENDMTTPKSYRQDGVIALLVGAVKELKTANDDLRREIATLRANDNSPRYTPWMLKTGSR